MKICPYCGGVADDNAASCPNCNRPLAPVQGGGAYGNGHSGQSNTQTGGAYDYSNEYNQNQANQNYGNHNHNDYYSSQQNYYGQQQGYPYGDPYGDRNNPFDEGPEGKSRGVAALLAIILGGLGVHYFYLGKVGAGLLTILLTFVTCGLWQVRTLIQGILMFCMTNEEFRRKYVLNPAFFPLF